MKKTYLIKMFASCFVGASLLTGCQKDNTVPEPQGTDDAYTVKYAKEIHELGEVDHRNWDATKWLGNDGVLSFLKEAKDLRGTEFVKNVPAGIKVIDNSYVYVTFVGKVANFNNVLGYYTYTEQEAAQWTEDNIKSELWNKIFQTNPDTKELAFKNVIFNNTKINQNFLVGTTFRISDDNGNKLPKGTIIGFYLLPNGGSGNDVIAPKFDKSGRPYIITTNKEINTNADGVEILSHIMGKSACSDLVVSFEDLNSMYSQRSDYDYNDLTFVIGDNLDSRYTCNLTYYSEPGKPFELDDSEMFGDPNYCMRCTEDDRYAYMLENIFVESRDITKYNQYKPLFQGVSTQGYLTVKENTKTGATTANLYAYFEHVGASYYNTVGWYKITKDNMTAAEIQAAVKSGNVINPENIIYKDVSYNIGTPAIPRGFIPVGTSKFKVGDKIGFFIIPRTKANQQVDFTTGLAAEVRYTTIIPTNPSRIQSQVIMSGVCNSIMVGFEDISVGGDRDFNDIIFSISDNTQNLRISSVETGGFYSLRDLIEALKVNPIP